MKRTILSKLVLMLIINSFAPALLEAEPIKPNETGTIRPFERLTQQPQNRKAGDGTGQIG